MSRSRRSGARYAALTTCILGLSGIALLLILEGQPWWAIWPIVFSLPFVGAVLKEEKEA
jgi:hypothetical protein